MDSGEWVVKYGAIVVQDDKSKGEQNCQKWERKWVYGWVSVDGGGAICDFIRISKGSSRQSKYYFNQLFFLKKNWVTWSVMTLTTSVIEYTGYKSILI